MNPEELIAFEKDIAACYDRGEIRAPVHLTGGNEQQLIKVFEGIDKNHDWVCCSWRSHYHCLLKGVPPEQLKADILAGKSITLTYPEHRIISSAIVGGILPIALGIAWSIRRNAGSDRVWAFVGDMTAHGGMYNECRQYAIGHGLPIMYVIEDNGLSVCTDTVATWQSNPIERHFLFNDEYYRYKLPYPHAGAGKRVQF